MSTTLFNSLCPSVPEVPLPGLTRAALPSTSSVGLVTSVEETRKTKLPGALETSFGVKANRNHGSRDFFTGKRIGTHKGMSIAVSLQLDNTPR